MDSIDILGVIFEFITNGKTVQNFVCTCSKFLFIGRKFVDKKKDDLKTKVYFFGSRIGSYHILPNGFLHGLYHEYQFSWYPDQYNSNSVLYFNRCINTSNGTKIVTKEYRVDHILSKEYITLFISLIIPLAKNSRQKIITFSNGYKNGKVFKMRNEKQLEYVREYKNGLLDGRSVIIDFKGKVEVISYYKNNSLDGSFRVFYSSGKISESGFYVNRKRKGEWESHWEDGTLYRREYYP